MNITRILLTWIVIVCLETLHGIMRQWLLVPYVGDLAARQIGVFSGSLLILVVVWFSYRLFAVCTRKQQLIIGGLWVVLTFVFEVVLGLATGFGFARIMSDYNVFEGGFMLFGMLVLGFSLVLVAKLKARQNEG